MQITRLTPDYAVAPQLHACDIDAVHAAGFRTLICNRPDHEEPGQPAWEELAAAARAAGLETVFLPVGGGLTVEDQRAAFTEAFADAPKPVLAFCRTGNRSTLIYNAMEAHCDD